MTRRLGRPQYTAPTQSPHCISPPPHLPYDVLFILGSEHGYDMSH